MARGEPLIRQWKIVKALQSNRYGVSTDELIEIAECGKRQVQRDLAVLQEVGFPIEFTTRDYGKKFWTLADDFLKSNDMIFDLTEVVSMYLSKQLLLPLAGTQFGDGLATLLQKMKAMLPQKALDHFSKLDGALMVKNIAGQDYSKHDKYIKVINQAVQEGCVIDLCYHSTSKKQPYSTQFHPYGIVFFDSNLYCIGFMEEYQEVRTIKVSRIVSTELTDMVSNRPAGFSLQSYTQGSFGIITSGKPQKIKMQLTGWAAVQVREQLWHHSQKITQDDNGCVTVQFDLVNTIELKRWIMGFGPFARVLSPKSLVKSIQADLADALACYE